VNGDFRDSFLGTLRTEGTLRLEGKGYPVRDGDIISFRFTVRPSSRSGRSAQLPA